MIEPETKVKALADILEAVGVDASTEQVKEIVKALDLYASIEEVEEKKNSY
jgi:ribosomal protein L12E/L44/L45/RPP1/RPP2